MQLEKRFVARDVTVKARKLSGIAAPFNSPARIGDFVERIEPGAFKRSLESGADVLALVDHDPGRLLGRTKNGTLRLSEDAAGLRFEIDLPSTSIANDILALAERGDLSGMSFGFRVRPGGERWNASRNERTLTDVELIEISVAQAFAAYGATSVQARNGNGATDNPLARRIRLLELEGGL